MADPVLDEELIANLVETKPSPDAVMRLLAGATMLLVDSYDRKTTRDEFLNIAHVALALHSYASQYGNTANMQAMAGRGKLDDAVFKQTMDNVTDLVEYYAAAAAKYARRLQECPRSKDKIH